MNANRDRADAASCRESKLRPRNPGDLFQSDSAIQCKGEYLGISAKQYYAASGVPKVKLQDVISPERYNWRSTPRFTLATVQAATSCEELNDSARPKRFRDP